MLLLETVFQLRPDREHVLGVREQILVEGDAELLIAVAHRVVGFWLNLDGGLEVGTLDRPVEDDGEPLSYAGDLAAALFLHRHVPDPRTARGDQQRQYQDTDAQANDHQP
jgi:hypothetical protein